MNICIYGASSEEIDKSYLESAERLGAKLARKGHGLVFGGGATGIMGASARGFASEGGYILGISPKLFDVDGVLYNGCTDFIYTETMSERKMLLAEKSDCYIAAPGGIGTFDEFFEILTLKQLGRHNKPIVLYNINGYYDAIAALMDNACKGKFLTEETIKLYRIISDDDELIDYIENYNEELRSVSDTKFIQR